MILICQSWLVADKKMISLVLYTTKGKEIKYVAQDTKELYFEKTYIQKIEELKELPQLETIVFDMTAFIKDFAFLSDAKYLRKLVLCTVSPNDLSIIEYMPNLEILILRACILNENILDLNNNHKLKYIELSYCRLNSFPYLKNVPSSLEYLNLSNNNIEGFQVSDFENTTSKILLYNNKIKNIDSENIIFDNPDEFLPELYKMNNLSH
jgi:Leucine-rich repeat (LRR) protein